MDKKLLAIMLTLALFIISCDKNKGIEAQIDPPNPIDIIWKKLEEPDIKYNYDWGDTCIVSMDYNDGKWIGLTQWQNVKLSPSDVEFQPIEFVLENNEVKKTGNAEPIYNRGYEPRVKFKNETPAIFYNETKNEFFGDTYQRILGDIDFESKSIINKKILPRGDTNEFGVDEFGNIYIPTFPNTRLRFKDRIFLKVSKGFGFKDQLFPKLYKKGLKLKHPEFTIDKYNPDLEKTDSFGRWNYWGNISDRDSLYKDMVLNVRHVNYYNEHIYTVSSLFGYIEKYDLDGNFVNHLDLHSITPLFYSSMGYLNGISYTKICNGKLYIMSGVPSVKLKNYVDIPDNILFVICLIKVDVSKEDMVLEKVYYYFPEEREEVMIKGVFSFVIPDENTFVQSTAKTLEVYKLK